ncbi:cell division protein FtsW (lipid II flippase) [Pullulanibacillus pueri]|uniref:Cell division protein FtsW n=1 Tax=Pullulanibacillus pueri TaxID=1437324 RepID=A0A8J2ZVD5_9BACL|nr:FtsW/RodA/SpoVE family cell cycle protein [Pullulanibacillus pueri]MBM7680899.1 cell division protein FtsW (lipid II flippase) [Pullulanibacillus pueri]GGH81254.1 cell division protein FtsW [Pullulanibacillus pueri]
MSGLRHQFLQTVTRQIKVKEVKAAIQRELDDHINHEKAHWIKKGLSEADAEEKAIKQMGSPLQLGQQLNKIHRPRIDWWIGILLLIILSVGLLPIGSFIQFTTQKVVYTLWGLALIISLMFFDYRKLKKFKWGFYIGGMLILFVLQFFHNAYINGNPYFIIGPLTIKSLMAIPLFYMSWAAFFRENHASAIKIGILFFVPFLLFISTSNLPTVIIYTTMVCVMSGWSQLDKRKMVKMYFVFFLAMLLLGGIFLNRTFMLLERLSGFLHPAQHANSTGYLYLRIREVLLNSGWLGHINTKDFSMLLHGEQTDYIFAAITYQYGWVFAIFLVLILGLLLYRMMYVVKKIKDPFGKILMVGAIYLFALQFIYNIGMNLGLLPLVGMSLPFISYGLMPTLMNSILIGIVLSVYRQKDVIFSPKSVV